MSFVTTQNVIFQVNFPIIFNTFLLGLSKSSFHNTEQNIPNKLPNRIPNKRKALCRGALEP